MNAHFEIAKERFLDLMANQSGATLADTRLAAELAITDADEFMAAYSKHGPRAPAAPLVGCRACHGSGGKRSAPCKTCSGTGKVSA